MELKHTPKAVPAVDVPMVDILLAMRRISRREIARQAGVHPLIAIRTLRNYPGVANEKRLAVIRALATALGVDVRDITLSGVEVNANGAEDRPEARQERCDEPGRCEGAEGSPV